MDIFANPVVYVYIYLYMYIVISDIIMHKLNMHEASANLVSFTCTHIAIV